MFDKSSAGAVGPRSFQLPPGKFVTSETTINFGAGGEQGERERQKQSAGFVNRKVVGERGEKLKRMYVYAYRMYVRFRVQLRAHRGTCFFVRFTYRGYYIEKEEKRKINEREKKKGKG